MSKFISSNLNKNITEKTKRFKEWYRLDNAATIFSLINSERNTNVFRVSCTLKERINIRDLQTSLIRVLYRFPYFDVSLQTGFFWRYWERNNSIPKIEAETKYPCQRLALRKNGNLPFRVKAYYNRIAIEFHHSITDGTGGITFLKALVADYLYSRGLTPTEWGDIYRPEQLPNPEEFNDAYKLNFQKDLPRPKVKRAGFRPPLTDVEKGVFHITTGKMSVQEILGVAREKKISITELLTTIYLESLQEILFDLPNKQQKKNMKPIRIAVPVNLRNIFPSKTMRNFSYLISPEINPKLGKYSFEEITKIVHNTLRKDVNLKHLSQQIARNVKGELFPLVRTAPLIVKELFGEFIYQRMGEMQNSGKLSNIGNIKMPAVFENEIENFEFILAPSSTITTGCAVGSFKDEFIINFSRTYKEPEVEKHFFRKLVELGIKVKIETN